MKNNVENKYNDITTEEAEKFVKAVLSENCAQCTKPTYALCGSMLPGVVTDGQYFVTFKPYSKLRNRSSKPFIVHCDVLPRQANRVASYREMVSKKYTDIRWEWFLTYTNITERVFEHALHNAGLKVWFSLNYDKIAETYGTYFTTKTINYKYGGKKDAND